MKGSKNVQGSGEERDCGGFGRLCGCMTLNESGRCIGSLNDLSATHTNGKIDQKIISE